MAKRVSVHRRSYPEILDGGYEVEILETAETETEASEWEAHWVAMHDSTNPEIGYNRQGGGLSGYKATAETRQKLGAAHLGNRSGLGRVHSAEHRVKIGLAQLGREKSAEHIAALGASNIGRRLPAESRAKIGAANARRKITDETKKKMRNRKASNATREKMKKAHMGRKHSAETRAKMKQSACKREAKKRDYNNSNEK